MISTICIKRLRCHSFTEMNWKWDISSSVGHNKFIPTHSSLFWFINYSHHFIGCTKPMQMHTRHTRTHTSVYIHPTHTHTHSFQCKRICRSYHISSSSHRTQRESNKSEANRAERAQSVCVCASVIFLCVHKYTRREQHSLPPAPPSRLNPLHYYCHRAARIHHRHCRLSACSMLIER